jgi:hypothetical protein
MKARNDMDRTRRLLGWLLLILLAGCGVTNTQLAELPATATVPATATAPALATVTAPAPTVAPTATSSAPRLPDRWPTPAAGPAASGYLYYSAIEQIAGDPPTRSNSFWRVPLDNLAHPEKIIELDNRPISFPNAGQLAPNGTYIAYAWKTFMAGPPDLRVMRTDGSEDRLVQSGIGNGFSRCNAKFAWSPDGTRLAFIDYGSDEPFEPFDNALVIYAPETDSRLPPLPDLGWSRIIAWEDNQHLLLLIAESYQQPRTIERIDVTSGTRTVLSTLPAIEGVFCMRASPDQRYAQLSLDSGGYLFDLDTGQTTQVDISVVYSLWSADSRLLLEFPYKQSAAPRLLPLDQVEQLAQPLPLQQTAPFPDPTHQVRIEGTSPDGRYVALCEGGETGPLRLLLYDIPRDQWQVVLEGPRCVKVLGWSAHAE